MEAFEKPLIEITLTKGPSVTVAVLELMNDGNVVADVVTGEARRHPRDHENRAIGNAYALGRAFRALSDQMIAFGDHAVEDAGKSFTAGSIINDLLKNYLDD